jgi:hypothetical protein
MWFIHQQTAFGNVAQESMPSPALPGTSGMFQKENMKTRKPNRLCLKENRKPRNQKETTQSGKREIRKSNKNHENRNS